MVSKKVRVQLLRECISLLEKADSLQRRAVSGDIADENHTRIEDLITDLEADIAELVD